MPKGRAILATPTLKAPGAIKQSTPSSAEAASTAAAAAQQYAQQLQAIPELAAFGSVLKSSAIVELTESETEYVVKAIKHIFKEHIVLQFVSCTPCTIPCVPLTSHRMFAILYPIPS